MTDEEIIAVVTAHKEGRAIQNKLKDKNYNDDWEDCPNTAWNFEELDYRIKPEPHYRPFLTAAEVMAAIEEHGSWITDGACNRQIVEFDDDGIVAGGGVDKITLSEAFDNIWNFVDGTPFGVKED